MIDIHAHLIPEVDDGPSSFEESLEIIQGGIVDGIKGAVATPHLFGDIEGQFKVIREKFEELRELLDSEKMDFELFLGAEFLLYQDIDVDLIAETGIGVFGGGSGRYVLFEFPPWPIPVESEEALFKLQLMGISPIIAHPERNHYVMEKLPEMAMRGMLFQVNASSLLGVRGRKIRKSVFRLIEEGMISFVASDAHDPRTRPMVMSTARSEVSEAFGVEVGDELFRDNPLRAVSGDLLELTIDHRRRSKLSKGIMNRLISLMRSI